jgi:hypothetical protein
MQKKKERARGHEADSAVPPPPLSIDANKRASLPPIVAPSNPHFFNQHDAKPHAMVMMTAP